MRLTSTTNSRLASAINVDPSLVSKLRSGVRSVSVKSDYLLPMSTYFGSKCQWGENPFHYTMYCPSYMLTTKKGKKFYAEAVEAGLKLTRGSRTDADFIFYDWESDPWVSRKGEPGNGSYCFCERCRAEFAKENKIDFPFSSFNVTSLLSQPVATIADASNKVTIDSFFFI